MATESSETNAASTLSPVAVAARDARENPTSLEQLVETLQAVCAKEQKLQRSHSFQLVKLQSQIQELQQHCGEDHKRHGALRDDVHGLHTTIAYLKGRIASLTIELTCIEAKVDQKPSLPPSTAAQQANVSRQHSLQARSTPPPPPATATLMNRLHATGGSMDALADELLREQKRRLLGKLIRFPLSDVLCLEIVLGKGANETPPE